ncbi:MAG: amino acid ABC transporter permease [Candidatus Bathyarchaeota archaeon]|nr:MAG: amino acid ABC transporter permease [Candidatus Bathyarchaeota archaeon]
MDLSEKLILILSGLPTTLAISILSFLLGFIIGLPLAFVRTYTSKPFQILVDGYEKVLRSVPEIVTMLFLYFGVGGIPAFRFPFKNSFFVATFALGLRSGANQSQVFRSAIRGIGEEQMVAARSLGLSRLQAVFHVMIPQTFIIATPGLGSEYALLVKDSSYSFILGVIDMMRRADTVRKTSLDTVFPYIATALLYILLTFPLATYLDSWGSRKKKELGL